jgi:hypothetical protein
MKPNGQRAQFPPQPDWFRDNRDFANLRRGLTEFGLAADDVDRILGGNWYDFYARAFPELGASNAGPSHYGQEFRDQPAAQVASR